MSIGDSLYAIYLIGAILSGLQMLASIKHSRGALIAILVLGVLGLLRNILGLMGPYDDKPQLLVGIVVGLVTSGLIFWQAKMISEGEHEDRQQPTLSVGA